MSKSSALYQLKIAAALAVLRSKPAGVDVQSYTKRFCRKCLHAQLQWRSRCLQAESAVLHLKQQRALCLMQSQGCMAQDEDHCFPTPPSSAQEIAGSDSSLLPISSSQALTSSAKFIHSIVSLVRAVQVESDDPSDLSTCKEKRPSSCEIKADVKSLLAETVPICVRHLRLVVSNGQTDVASSCVLLGLDSLILLMNTDWTACVGGGYHLHHLLQHFGDLVDDLLQRLFEFGQDNIVKSVHNRRLLHQMLLHLTTKMRGQERFSLLQSVAMHAKTLCVSMSHYKFFKTPVNPSHYECLAIALDCLQQGVMNVKIEELHWESLREIQQSMEGVLSLELAHQFPLVANTVMRLISMIEMCAQSHMNHCD